MKNFFSKVKNGIKNVLTNIRKAFDNLRNIIKNTFNRIKNRNQNSKSERFSKINNEPISINNLDIVSQERKTDIKDVARPVISTKYRTWDNDAFITSDNTNEEQNNNSISSIDVNNEIDEESNSYTEKYENKLNGRNKEKIISIEINENIGIVNFETISGKKYQKNIEDVLSEKKDLYKNWNINKKCNDFAKNKIQALRLKRKLNPVIISTLDDEDDIENYIKCVNDIEKVWFNLEHSLINSKLKGKNARLMLRAGKFEEKIGAKVKRKENLIERMLKKIKTKNREPEEMVEEIEKLEKDEHDVNEIEEEVVQAMNEKEKKSKKEKRLEEERKKTVEEKRRLEEQGKAELAEFNKRYKDYNILARGLLGGLAKKDINDIRNDVVHNDIYDMTSEDDSTKGIATFRVGHRLATLSTKKKEAERLLKESIKILKNDNLLSKDGSLLGILQNAHMDLGNLYLMNGNYIEAEKSFVDYMDAVKKEKIERYDPKIIEAKKSGRVIDEIDLWIEVKSKFTAGKKSMIRLLSKSGKTDEAEELYKKLLEDCKLSLSDEEYQLSVDTNCIENGQYMRITNGRTYREPILGNEYLLLKRKNISDKALAER